MFDEGGHFASSAWTPPAGRYALTAATLFTGGIVDAEQYRIAIYRNGVLLHQTVQVANGTAAFGVNVSAAVVADGTDVFEVYVTGAGSGDKTVSGASANTWFAGWAI